MKQRLQQVVGVVHGLGPFLTLMLLLSVLSLVLFADLSEDVVSRDEIVTVDETLAAALHRWAPARGPQVGQLVSLLGSEGVFAIGAIAGTWYLLRRRWFELLVWLVALAGGELLNALLKQLFARPRPVFADPWVIERYYSFPSGHAMLSLITYGMLAYFLMRRLSGRLARVLLGLGTATLIILIGLSRMYLGVHYLSDVVAGYLAGSTWLAGCIIAIEVRRRRQRPTTLQKAT